MIGSKQLVKGWEPNDLLRLQPSPDVTHLVTASKKSVIGVFEVCKTTFVTTHHKPLQYQPSLSAIDQKTKLKFFKESNNCPITVQSYKSFVSFIIVIIFIAINGPAICFVKNLPKARNDI